MENTYKESLLVEISAFDGVLAFKFLQLLTKPFEKWDAYTLGIIDENGRTLKKAKTRDEKKAYGLFERLVKNLKLMMAKVPGGKSRLGSYIASLFLLKEEYGLSEDTCKQMTKYLIAEMEANDIDIIYPRENVSYMMIAKGKYELDTGVEVLIRENQKPATKFMGVTLYESTLNTSGQSVLFAYENIKETF